VDIMTDNVMTLEHRDISEKTVVHAMADQAAHNHVAQLRDQQPDLYKKLDSMELSEERANAALRTLQSLGDLRVHEVRKSIMEAIQDTMKESGGHKALKRHLVEKFGPQTEKMRQLYGKYFTHLPRGPVANGVVLQEHHLDHMELVKSFDKITAQLKSSTKPQSTLSRKLTSTNPLDEFISFFTEFMGSSSSSLQTPEYSGTDVVECLTDLMENSQTDISTCFSILMDSFSGGT
jgi:hypothetical protein